MAAGFLIETAKRILFWPEHNEDLNSKPKLKYHLSFFSTHDKKRHVCPQISSFHCALKKPQRVSLSKLDKKGQTIIGM